MHVGGITLSDVPDARASLTSLFSLMESNPAKCRAMLTREGAGWVGGNVVWRFPLHIMAPDICYVAVGSGAWALPLLEGWRRR